MYDSVPTLSVEQIVRHLRATTNLPHEESVFMIETYKLISERLSLVTAKRNPTILTHFKRKSEKASVSVREPSYPVGYGNLE